MPTSKERVPVVVVEYDEIAKTIARRIAEIMKERRREGGHAVLGLATGSTPIGIYRELIRMHREEGLDFSDVVTFNLDEYYPMRPESIHSYHRFMRENLFNHINVKPENVHIPKGDVPRDDVEEECEKYEAAIKKAGGIDLQILGIGKTGHIGFNEPGSGSDSRTRRIALDTVTPRLISSARTTFQPKRSPWVSRPSWKRARSRSSPLVSTRPRLSSAPSK